MQSTVSVHLRKDSRITWHEGEDSHAWVTIEGEGSTIVIHVASARDAERLTAALQIARNHA